MEIKDATDRSSLVKHSGSYASEKDEIYDYYGFDVRFDRPVRLEANKEYILVSQIEGPYSWYGEDGQTSVACQGVRFTFHALKIVLKRTTEARGQFPAFLFS